MIGSMRTLAVLLACAATAHAAPNEPTVVRADLTSMSTRVWEMKAGKLVEVGRETRTYDATGHVVLDENRKPDGTLVVSVATTYDTGGRMTGTTYKDATRTIVRTISYTVDANGRVTERVERDPSADPKEFRRYAYTWEPGGHTEQAFRHYPKEGPYRSDSEVFDANGRLSRSCSEHGGCSMYEYDTHGEIARIRQQSSETHYYLVYESTYDKSGRLAKQTIGGSDTEYTWTARDVSTAIVRDIARYGGAVKTKTEYAYVYR